MTVKIYEIYKFISIYVRISIEFRTAFNQNQTARHLLLLQLFCYFFPGLNMAHVLCNLYKNNAQPFSIRTVALTDGSHCRRSHTHHRR